MSSDEETDIGTYDVLKVAHLGVGILIYWVWDFVAEWVRKLAVLAAFGWASKLTYRFCEAYIGTFLAAAVAVLVVATFGSAAARGYQRSEDRKEADQEKFWEHKLNHRFSGNLSAPSKR